MDFQLLANLNILNILITLKGVRTVPSMLSTNEKDISKILIRTIRQSSLLKESLKYYFKLIPTIFISISTRKKVLKSMLAISI